MTSIIGSVSRDIQEALLRKSRKHWGHIVLASGHVVGQLLRCGLIACSFKRPCYHILGAIFSAWLRK